MVELSEGSAIRNPPGRGDPEFVEWSLVRYRSACAAVPQSLALLQPPRGLSASADANVRSGLAEAVEAATLKIAAFDRMLPEFKGLPHGQGPGSAAYRQFIADLTEAEAAWLRSDTLIRSSFADEGLEIMEPMQIDSEVIAETSPAH